MLSSALSFFFCLCPLPLCPALFSALSPNVPPQGVGLVVCGDDKGSLWLYNMPTMVQVSNRCNVTRVDLQFLQPRPTPQTQPEPMKRVVDPTTRLMWPELQDDHLENSRKVGGSSLYLMPPYNLVPTLPPCPHLTMTPYPHLATLPSPCYLPLAFHLNPPQVPLDRHDIIIDKVAASFDNNHIVAVTSNNMVGSRTSDS